MGIHDGYYTQQFRDRMGFYDTHQFQQQVDFVERAVGLKPGQRVLDLACGWGRHTLCLARKGCDVVGYDASADFLAEARQAARDAGLDVPFEQADMRQLDLREAFDVVLSMSTSLAFYDEQTNLDILRRIAAALRPGGVFFFDQANIFWVIELLIRKNASGARNLPDGRVCTSTYSFDAPRMILSHRCVLEGAGRREEAGWDIRYYTLPELRWILPSVGLKLLQTYGDFDGNPYTLDSKRLITVSKKA